MGSGDNERFWCAGGHAIGMFGDDIFVQVRTTAMTIEAIDKITMYAHLTRARKPGRKFAGLLVLADAAPPSTTRDVLAKQRALIEAFATDENFRACVVIPTTSIGLQLQVTAFRFFFKNARREFARSVDEGATWVCGALGKPEAKPALVAFVAELTEDCRASAR